MNAFDESILIEVKAAKAGTEVKTESGIVIGRREHGEIPTTGLVISVGQNVPEYEARFLLDKTVLLPNGRMSNVTDPRVVAGTLLKGEDQRQLVATHYKNIQVVY